MNTLSSALFSVIQTNDIYTQQLRLSYETVTSNNFSDIVSNTPQGIINITNATLNTGNFINFEVSNNLVNENSLIFVSVLSCEPSFALVINTFSITNNSFRINVTNVGSAGLSNDIVKIAFLVIN